MLVAMQHVTGCSLSIEVDSIFTLDSRCQSESKNSNMDTFPDEIWMSIFSEVCIDDGTTGRWLELVSKDFQRPFNLIPINLLAQGEANHHVRFDGEEPPSWVQ